MIFRNKKIFFMVKIDFEKVNFEAFKYLSHCQFTKYKHFLPGYLFFEKIYFNLVPVRNSITHLTILYTVRDGTDLFIS